MKKVLEHFDIKSQLIVFILVIVWSIFTFTTDGSFLEARNISNLLRQASITSILAIGMLFVIISGEIDLSIGSKVAFLGAIFTLFDLGHTPIYFNFIILLIIATFLGAIDGWLISYKKIPSFITTLAGMLIFRGLTLFITKGYTIGGLSNEVLVISNYYISSGYSNFALFVILGIIAFNYYLDFNRNIVYKTGNQDFRVYIIKFIFVWFVFYSFVFLLNQYQGIPLPFIIMFIIAYLFKFISQSTVFGKYVYAIGCNEIATNNSGIDVKFNKMKVYAVNGALIGIAAILLLSRTGAATPSAGTLLELDAIAACFVGGASMKGGIGTVVGAVVGALIMASLKNGMTMMNVDSYWQQIFSGLILLAAVWIDLYKNKAK